MMKTLIALLAVFTMYGCAADTQRAPSADCKKPKLPKQGQDMTQYAEYLLKHIKRNCN